MITFKPEVFSHHRKQDGTYNIKIRVTFNRKSRHLPTSLYCTQGDLTRSLKLKNGDLINKANALCNQMRAACADLNIFDLEDRDVDYVVRHIREALKTENFRLDFFEWSEQYLSCKYGQTKRVYHTALNSFERFLGKREIDINDISYSLLSEFWNYLNNMKKVHYYYHSGEKKESDIEKKSKSTSSLYMIKLSHLFNAAKEKYNDEDSSRILIPKSPFDKVRKEFTPAEGQRNLGQDIIQRIINAEAHTERTRIALDTLILSFGLMGGNLADLYHTPSFVDDVWVYNRQKTRGRRADRAEMRVTIPPEMHPYIERLKGKGRWWLNVLHDLSDNENRCCGKINRCLKRWCELNDIPVFTFYAARHTWATLARKAGVEKATIDECLAHKGDFNMTDIYAERDWDLINQANRKVLDMFRW